jgi:hypothetical protein
MTIQLKNLVPGTSQLTNAAATYYTAPAGTSARINNATLLNTDVVARTATVHIVPSGGAAGNANMIISARSIQPGETYNCPELVAKNVMAGGTIQALASANATISFHVSGLEQT